MRTVSMVILLFSVVICVRSWPVLYHGGREHKFILSVVLGLLTVWNLILLAGAIDAWMAR